MLKNSLPTFIGLALASAAFNSAAALPPKYLAIEDFKQCLATQKINTYSAWCMPAKKFESCPTTSWEQLQALSGADKLPDCPHDSSVPKP
ncbi:MAG: hypothetical protein WCL27_10900, partial [Betaproteobacteria bacterium]